MTDKAIEKGRTERYLPKEAWAKLTAKERRETDEKKKAASKQGKQFVPNTERAKKARKAVSKAEQQKMK